MGPEIVIFRGVEIAKNIPTGMVSMIAGVSLMVLLGLIRAWINH